MVGLFSAYHDIFIGLRDRPKIKTKQNLLLFLKVHQLGSFGFRHFRIRRKKCKFRKSLIFRGIKIRGIKIQQMRRKETLAAKNQKLPKLAERKIR
jgi:hypothetical protein